MHTGRVTVAFVSSLGSHRGSITAYQSGYLARAFPSRAARVYLCGVNAHHDSPPQLLSTLSARRSVYGTSRMGPTSLFSTL